MNIFDIRKPAIVGFEANLALNFQLMFIADGY